VTQPSFSLAPREIEGRASAVVVVRAGGEVDTTNAAEFAEAIDAVPGPRPLIVDLSGLDYIDSAGFAAVDGLLSRQAIKVVLDPHCPIRAAAELIELPSHDTIEDALS
jgi:anti-sigma B factor antagonist